MSVASKIHEYRQSKTALVAVILVQVAVLYGLISWAIDSGSLQVYALAILLLAHIIFDVIQLVRLAISGFRPRTVKVTSGKR